MTLANCRIAYCDSYDVLKAARSDGLPNDCVIRTSSPFLAAQTDGGIVNYETLVPVDVYRDLIEGSETALKAVVRSAEDAIGSPTLARLIGRTAFILQIAILKAAVLTEEDYASPVAVLEGDTRNPALDPFVRSVWADLLDSNPDRVVYRVPARPADDRAALGGDPPSIRQRLARPNAMKWTYQAALRLARKAPRLFQAGDLLVMTENEFAKETAGYLALRGWRTKAVRASTMTPLSAEEDAAIHVAVERIGDEAIRPYAARFTVPAATEALVRLFRQRAATDVSLYHRHREPAERIARTTRQGRTMIFLGGSNGVTAAYSDAFQRRKAPVVMFQHGLDREISERLQKQRICYDTALAPFFVGYNETARTASADNPFSLPDAKLIAAAAPREYFPAAPTAPKQEILYVSTLLYRAYTQPRFDERSDADLAADEVALIDDVFGHLPARMGYKPYPAIRYLDPDPLYAALQRHDNIDVVGGKQDGRYIYQNYRVLVMSRATSTLGWLLAANRPLVYIDVPGAGALRPEIRPLFEAGTFFFDASKDGWRDDLRRFLSLPLAKIEALFEERRASHDALREHLLPGKGHDGAKRAAAALLSLLEQAPTPTETEAPRVSLADRLKD